MSSKTTLHARNPRRRTGSGNGDEPPDWPRRQARIFWTMGIGILLLGVGFWVFDVLPPRDRWLVIVCGLLVFGMGFWMGPWFMDYLIPKDQDPESTSESRTKAGDHDNTR
jgi:hypothetical protein